jgi:hypothetical protein
MRCCEHLVASCFLCVGARRRRVNSVYSVIPTLVDFDINIQVRPIALGGRRQSLTLGCFELFAMRDLKESPFHSGSSPVSTPTVRTRRR